MTEQMPEEIPVPEPEGGDPSLPITEARQMLRQLDSLLEGMLPGQPEMEEEEETPEPETMTKTMVYYGDTVKALGNGKVGGYLVRFSTKSDPDLTGEYFTADTDFGPAQASPVLYHHGMDTKIGLRELGSGTLKRDAVGVWIEAQLNLRDEYEKAIYEMAKAEKMGWSSGTASHLVTRKGAQITRWPLGLDASLTPTPAEPRNGAQPLKAIPTDTGLYPVVDTQLKSVSNHFGVTMEITQEQLDALVSKTVNETMKALPATQQAGANVSVTRDAADQPFKSVGEFFQAVKNAAFDPMHEDKRLRPLKATGLSEGVPADGGYLLQPMVASGIIERMYTTGKILGAVNMLNIGPNSNSMVFNGVDETSRADGSRWGGLQSYWLAEAATKTATKPKFRQMELKLKKVAALAYATDELLADATALESWLTRTVPEELRFRVEDAFYNGDGVGKPLGFMQSPALISVPRVATSAIAYTDILNMWARRWAGVSNYVWLVNQDVTPQLDAMVLSGSTEIPLRFVDYDQTGTMRMKGAPVVEVEYAATLGTAGDIVLADLSQYQAIQKGGVEVASSIHVQFVTDESVFRFVYRCDGQSLWHSALTPFKGTNTQSPFVALSAATA